MSLNSNTSIVIVTYNHQYFIEECLKSLIKEKTLEIIVVDNNSTDKTVEIIQKNFKQIKLIKNHENTGYGSGINLGVKTAKGKYLVIINPDTKIKENSIHELLKPLKEDENLITTSKILYYDGNQINTCGNKEHFTGLAFTRGLGDDPKCFNDFELVNGLSGVCFALKKDNFRDIGGFDENFFIYMEDTELSWRCKAKGLKVLYVPTSVVYHDYTLVVTPEKLYHLEKGRYIILRRYLTWREYLIVSPSLIMTEILTWGYSILEGPSGIKFKLLALRDGLFMEIKEIKCDRRELLKSLDWKIPTRQLSYTLLDRSVRKIANLIYKFNYHLL